MNHGVDIGGKKVCLLLYADDNVIIAANENDLQTQLDCNNVIRKRNYRESNFVLTRQKFGAL